jgi:sigma-54 dependent transcriptional regulator, acetoin dehydrogenase operon transcriptional activator AcoR
LTTLIEGADRASAALGMDLAMRPEIAAGWHDRSRDFGLRESDIPDYCAVGPAELSHIIDHNRSLHSHAVPVMETLYEQIRNTHSMVILTDHRGLIIHALGDDDFLEKAERVALRTGVLWSEQSKGTNAIGTALLDGRPTLVHADDHYLRVNRFLTCSCAPIVDTNGDTIGALDVSGDKATYHRHTMALVRMSVQMIENHLFADNFSEAVRIHFHTRPEFIGTLVEGIVAFSPAGRFLAANRSAQFQLGLSQKALQTHTISSLFGIPMSALFDHYRTANPGLLSLCMHDGVAIRARAELRTPAPMFGGLRDDAGAPDWRRPPVEAPTATAKAAAHLCTLNNLDTGDPQIARAIAKVRQVQRHEIPVLILGETGTGKELLAQAIHNESARRERPFVAVNCASIPDSLIEAELFGYEEGAFTGARKKGSIGKMQLANGGTLFLDEIGDMPLNLQARLLRVLQDRMVTPLGSVKSIAVNIAVICATNRNLQEMIRQGQFRQDLYYRLNGLVVKLPPLRARADLEAVIARILSAEGDAGAPRTVAPDVLALFARSPWPGNLRQLTNVLRTARIMAHGEPMIGVDHLSEDFFEELQQGQSAAAPQMPSGADPVAPWAPTRHDAAFAAEPPSRPAQPVVVLGDATSMGDVQASAIVMALKKHNGNVSAAARALNVSRNTIYRRLGMRTSGTSSEKPSH